MGLFKFGSNLALSFDPSDMKKGLIKSATILGSSFLLMVSYLNLFINFLMGETWKVFIAKVGIEFESSIWLLELNSLTGFCSTKRF